MDEVVESLSGEVLRILALLLNVEASRNDDGVRGALEIDGDLRFDGSRLAVDALLNFIGSLPGGDRTAGQRDLSLGRALPPLGAR